MTAAAALDSVSTWSQILDLLIALVLSSLIGLEREYRQKSAGLRTHALVGVGTALFVLVSKYGFTDVMFDGITRYDPSRIAAQIVSGIGFIGGGLIFVRRDAVQGLTTAASIWVTCAVGMACGAHLYWIAVAGTVTHFLIAFGLTPVARRLPGGPSTTSQLHVAYAPGEMVLAHVLKICTAQGYVVLEVAVDKGAVRRWSPTRASHLRVEDEGFGTLAEDSLALVSIRILGKASLAPLVAALVEIPGLLRVETGDGPVE